MKRNTTTDRRPSRRKHRPLYRTKCRPRRPGRWQPSLDVCPWGPLRAGAAALAADTGGKSLHRSAALPGRPVFVPAAERTGSAASALPSARRHMGASRRHAPQHRSLVVAGEIHLVAGDLARATGGALGQRHVPHGAVRLRPRVAGHLLLLARLTLETQEIARQLARHCGC